jgi:hypothetical protein
LPVATHPFLFLTRSPLDLEREDAKMHKMACSLGLGLFLAGCGAGDRCTAPAEPNLVAVKDLSLVDKANALGVPPDRVPDQPKSASSYGALISGVNDNAEAQSVYETYVARKNDVLKQNYCVENEAYKARAMKDEMSTVSHAVMATCHSDDEQAALAAILKYRNCASGH